MLHKHWRRKATLLGLLVVVGVMVMLVSYSVTLYRLFCEVTGAYGTTARAEAAPGAVAGKVMTVYFDTSVAPGLPWHFRPLQRKVTVRLGEPALVFFEAENTSDTAIVGRATFNVTPEKVGIYFKKIECFCFSEERLEPHMKADMPVQFFVDPQIATDRSTADVDQITLSYTFFRSVTPEAAADLGRFGDAPPDPKLGAALFARDCSGCHELEGQKIGPPLGHAFGRAAASVPGYPYSAALKASGLVWTAASLDQWLAGPAKMVPGALMSFAVPDAASRRAIIAYLAAVGRNEKPEPAHEAQGEPLEGRAARPEPHG